ncbi:Major Facilitator Superfamily protein [Brevibacterium siliguriense]|uniref:Major Facilitator Superfamily protein n=1 Tax=Brevibacterium siliguriense TaxID=1136497 RepID=A0A1H1PTW2_9MICO|nr:MFS transporter [Brevibacterium siliguriense]SDS14702.1 Major Facilitator Superfamily protein [Brevibacterium siliguriense]
MLKPILWPVLVPFALFAVGLGAIMPILVLGALSLGSTQAFAAAIVGIMGAVSLMATVPAGILIDRLGDFRAMFVATIAAIVVLGSIVSAFIWDSPYSLLVYTLALMVFGPVSDVWSLARQAVVAEVMPPADLAKAMTALGGTQRVGNLVGPMIGAGLMLLFPIWSVFVFSGLTAVAAIAIMALPIAQIPGFDDRTHRAEAAPTSRTDAPSPADDLSFAEAADPAQADAAHPRRGKKKDRRPPLDVRWKSVILTGVTIIALAAARAAQPVVVQLWGVEIGLHKSSISLIIAFGAGFELIVMFLGAYIKDHLGRVATLVACLTIFGTGFVIMVAKPDLTGMVIAAAVMAFGNGLGAGVNMTIGADLSPTIGRPRFLGIWAIFNNGGKLGGPTLLSLIITVTSLRFGVLFPGLLAILGAVWILIWGRQVGLPGRRRRLDPPSRG